ncbi:hypothetical protein AWH49_02305 [Domibacillus aminovorans]|uniref:Uncharacterized protein n=1 Tax=Domibacillus aminovorans TaxID=29332 RepID=A0A177L5Z8_9BACI|nr:hypothetical protein AWH49_02305 [Domibacillus aminovorans]
MDGENNKKLDGPFLTIFSMIKDEGMAVKWMVVPLFVFLVSHTVRVWKLVTFMPLFLSSAATGIMN